MTKYREYPRMLATGCLLGMTALLAACGSGGSGNDHGSPGGNTTVRGTAAIGAPLAGAGVVLHCLNNWNEGTTTDDNGVWQMAVPTENLPCAVRVTAVGEPPQPVFYSLATRGANTVTANATPLTSLALARALGVAPDDAWFNALGNDGLQTAADALPAAVVALNAALAAYAVPDNFNPFSSALDVTVSGDGHDGLLEQFRAALGGSSFDALLAAFAGNGVLPAPAGSGGSDTIAMPALGGNEFGVRFATNGSVQGAVESGVVRFIDGAGGFTIKNGSLLEAYVLDSTDSTLNLDLRWLLNEAGSHVCGDSLGAGDNQKTIALGFAANNGYSSLGTKGVAGFSCVLNITHVGSISGSNYTGYIEGNFKARLFKTGAPVSLEKSIVVAGVFRIGTGPVEGGSATPPTLTGFAPVSAAVGDTVTLTGTGFNTTPANNTVRFTGSTGTGIQASVVSGTATQLVVNVPVGAQTGPLTVYNGVAAVSSSGSFTVSAGGSSVPATRAGQFAAAIGASFAGTYLLSCNGTAHSVTVNADGSSLIDSTPLTGTTGYGRIEVASANTISGKYHVEFLNNSNASQAIMNFASDGSADGTVSWQLFPVGSASAQFCTLISGPAARLDRLAVLKTLAPLSAGVTCTASAPAASADVADGAQTFSLAADGSLLLGGSVTANTMKSGLSSVQVSFFDAYIPSYGSAWYEPAFYSPATAPSGSRALDVRLGGDGSMLKSVKLYGASGSSSQCLPAS